MPRYIDCNDFKRSEIEPEKFKVDRIKEFAGKIFSPRNVKVGYSRIDYTHFIAKIVERSKRFTKDERALLFIDPWGYWTVKEKSYRSGED